MGGMTRANNIPFTLAAGARLDIPSGSAEFIYLAEATSGADLRLQGAQVDVPLIVGRRIDFGRGDIHGLSITNTGAGSVEGLLFIGSGGVTDSTVVGTVSVTNADKSRTEANSAFMRGKTATAAAANYSFVLIENPLASGVSVFVNKIIASVAGAASAVQLQTTTDGATARGGATYLSAADNMAAKKIGGSGGLATLYDGYNAAALLSGASAIQSLNIGADDPFEYALTEPYLLPAGAALAIVCLTVNLSVRVNVESFEESA